MEGQSLLLQTRHSESQQTVVQLIVLRSQSISSISAPATGTLVAVAHRVADNGRYSTFRVMVYEEERIIAEFDGVAIQVNTRQLRKDNSMNYV